ncbi:hypothetical protein E2562_014560 [Oryza meyeriana var. granulata]|uniref:EF-hand domain-containing protein n=1 Tax=Oryza meyeriana var. granulata TaxID=110450 RepID=A0A6G1EJB3_9ORYZ|nr:hypothetical protein E2562_014560 [Oryza meyeriana var. granulata]
MRHTGADKAVAGTDTALFVTPSNSSSTSATSNSKGKHGGKGKNGGGNGGGSGGDRSGGGLKQPTPTPPLGPWVMMAPWAPTPWAGPQPWAASWRPAGGPGRVDRLPIQRRYPLGSRRSGGWELSAPGSLRTIPSRLARSAPRLRRVSLIHDHDPLPPLPASPPAAFPSVSLTDGDDRVGNGEHEARSPTGDGAGGRVGPVTANVRKWLLYLFPMLDCAPKDGGVSQATLEAWLRWQAADRIDALARRELKKHDRDGDGSVTLRDYLVVDPDQHIDNPKFRRWQPNVLTLGQCVYVVMYCSFLHPENSSKEKVLSLDSTISEMHTTEDTKEENALYERTGLPQSDN